MERYGNSPMTHVNSKFRKNMERIFITNIEREYSLQKSIFDPTKKPQNYFLNNLEKRMKDYYDKLYNSRNCSMK